MKTIEQQGQQREILNTTIISEAYQTLCQKGHGQISQDHQTMRVHWTLWKFATLDTQKLIVSAAEIKYTSFIKLGTG